MFYTGGLATIQCGVERAHREPGRMRLYMLYRMQSTSVRIDVVTHQELKRLASGLGATVGETVTLAVRRFSQDQIGEQLRADLTPGEVSWLDADLG